MLISGEVERGGLVNSEASSSTQEGRCRGRGSSFLVPKIGLRTSSFLNKIDRPHADPDRALNLTFDLCLTWGE
jgi:GTP-binding protein